MCPPFALLAFIIFLALLCWHWRMPEICQDLLDISRSNHPKENGGILTNVAVLYLQLFVKPSDGLSGCCWSTRKAHSKKDQCFPIKTVPLSRSRFLPKKFHHMKQNCTQKEPKNDHMKAIENKPESPTIFLWPIPVKKSMFSLQLCTCLFIGWIFLLLFNAWKFSLICLKCHGTKICTSSPTVCRTRHQDRGMYFSHFWQKIGRFWI